MEVLDATSSNLTLDSDGCRDDRCWLATYASVVLMGLFRKMSSKDTDKLR